MPAKEYKKLTVLKKYMKAAAAVGDSAHKLTTKNENLTQTNTTRGRGSGDHTHKHLHTGSPRTTQPLDVVEDGVTVVVVGDQPISQ